MKPRLLLYSRKDCCLCDDMKAVIGKVAADRPLTVQEIDIDSAPELHQRFSDEVPVLFIDGRKAFKYRVTSRQLQEKLTGTGSFWKGLAKKTCRR